MNGVMETLAACILDHILSVGTCGSWPELMLGPQIVQKTEGLTNKGLIISWAYVNGSTFITWAACSVRVSQIEQFLYKRHTFILHFNEKASCFVIFNSEAVHLVHPVL